MTGFIDRKCVTSTVNGAMLSRTIMAACRLARPACGLLVAVTMCGVATAAHTESLPNGVCDARAQEAILDFTLSNVDGDAVNLSTYKGNVIVLNFWATWCEPCKVEIPLLITLHDKYRAQGLTVIGLALDRHVEKVQEFVQRLGMNYPIFMIGPDHSIDKAYAPRWGVPATVVIRRDGVICRRQIGALSEGNFEKRLLELLRATGTSR